MNSTKRKHDPIEAVMKYQRYMTLTARLFCGYTLLVCALTTIGAYDGPFAHSWMNFDYVSQFRFLTVPLVLLMAIFALWLMLGIRTRIIAFSAMVLITVLILFDFSAPSAVYGPAAIWEFLHATGFLFSLLVLTIQGGGETALVRGGWQGLF